MSTWESPLAGEARLAMFETFRPPLARLRESLASGEPAEAVAAAQALARRADEGEDEPEALAACVPERLFALPAEALAAIAELAVRGVPIALPKIPAELPPALAERFRCAEILASPEALPIESASPADLAAVNAAPPVRAVTSGLWRRAASHADPAMHDAAIRILRAALEGALVAPDDAQEVLVGIARRSSPRAAARALSLLAEPWAHGLPCPALHAFDEGLEVALAVVQLAAARGEIEWVRRSVWNDAWLGVRRAAVAALGTLGDGEDVEALLAAAEDSPAGLGPEVALALCALKRRGIAIDEAQARAVLDLVLRCEAVNLQAAAESVSSRADALVAAIDERLGAGASKARAVAFLEALGTRRTIGRLVEMAADAGDRALSRFAIRALGRLEERAAEATILGRLEAEPDACLFALRRVGGAVTAQRLRAVLAGKAPPWLGDALAVLLRIDPSPEVLALAADHEAISHEALEALPAYAGLAQTEVLARIAAAPGHPLREAAVAALGNSGGPAAIDALGALLCDVDEAFRGKAKDALRRLGQRLSGPEPPLACLEGAEDAGAMIVAEAALRRLSAKEVPPGDAALLLDAVAGCAHPRLVRVVRPYLRRSSPELKKRAAACLAAAGPACASWLLPSLEDARLPVARQALLAIGRAAVPGLGPTIARWLAHPNMNLKKTAAEALAACRDPQVIAPIVDALAHTDQPGYRALLEEALRAVAGSYSRAILVSALVAAGDGRPVKLLAQALAGALGADELGALVAARPGVPPRLLEQAYAEENGKVQGQLERLDAVMVLRGVAHRIPHEEDVAPDSALRAGLARADAARRARALRRRIREVPFLSGPSEALVAAVRAAGDRTLPVAVSLSVQEQRLLAGLLPAFDAATRDAAIGLLAGATDPTVVERVLPHVDVTGEVDPRHAGWLRVAIARRDAGAARALSDHADPAVRRAAGAVLAVAGDDDLRRLPAWERAAAVDARLGAGRIEEILAAMEGKDAISPREVAQAIAERRGAAAALGVIERWVARDFAGRVATLLGLSFLGDAMVPRLRALLAEDVPGEIRGGALAFLAIRRAIEPAFVRPLLDDAHPAVREEAARALLACGDREDHERVRAAWLEGALRRTAFRMSLDEQDAPAVESAVRGAEGEGEQRRLLAVVEALPVRERVPLLLALRASPHVWVAGIARDELRDLPAAAVLPHIGEREREDDASWLEVIGAAGAVPPALAELAAASDARKTPPAAGPTLRDDWTAFLLRCAGVRALYAGGLGERIAAWAAEDPSSQKLALVTRLTDWFDPGRAERLVAKLSPALSGSRRERVLHAVLSVLRDRPAAFVVRVLSPIVTPADTEAVRMLAAAEAEAPGILDLLPPALRGAVDRAIGGALEAAGSEDARKLLSYFAARAERPSDREATLAILERAVGSPEPRISLHAHRLLRTLAPRERYFRATRRLLESSDPTTVRLAVRVLAFGGDGESVGLIAERLFHPHTAVSRAARQGLLALGERAIESLLGARARLRPDKRAVVDSVLEEIRGRTRPDEGSG